MHKAAGNLDNASGVCCAPSTDAHVITEGMFSTLYRGPPAHEKCASAHPSLRVVDTTVCDAQGEDTTDYKVAIHGHNPRPPPEIFGQCPFQIGLLRFTQPPLNSNMLTCWRERHCHEEPEVVGCHKQLHHVALCICSRPPHTLPPLMLSNTALELDIIYHVFKMPPPPNYMCTFTRSRVYIFLSLTRTHTNTRTSHFSHRNCHHHHHHYHHLRHHHHKPPLCALLFNRRLRLQYPDCKT